MRVCGRRGSGVGGRKKVSDTLSPYSPAAATKNNLPCGSEEEEIAHNKNIFFYGGLGGKEFRAGTISVQEQELYPTSAPFHFLACGE